MWQSGWVPSAIDKAKWKIIALSSDLGFKVDEILVIGRRETAQKDLLAAVQLARGAPILAFDLKAARKRIEALPWIKTVSVERMLPDTVLLNIEERRPLALWQHKGAFALIDSDGEVILKTGLERFSDLIVVVGRDAPAQAAELLKTLASEPQLMDRVRAAVRIGGRRWNLRFDNGIDVELPEQGLAEAWRRLAAFERRHRLLSRDITAIDLRLPDRVVVRPSGVFGVSGAAGEST